jgi:hypothetical protein
MEAVLEREIFNPLLQGHSVPRGGGGTRKWHPRLQVQPETQASDSLPGALSHFLC